MPEGNQAITSMIRWGMAAFYALLTVIGVWWLVLFNRSRTKDYFGRQEPVSERARPLSVSVIAWCLLVGAACMVPSLIFRFPAVLFGIFLTGWVTLAVYTAFAAAQIYLGTGLLHLREQARVGAIGYFCFGAVNSAVSLVRRITRS